MDDFDEFVAGNLEQLLKTAYLITWDAGEVEDLPLLDPTTSLPIRLGRLVQPDDDTAHSATNPPAGRLNELNNVPVSYS